MTLLEDFSYLDPGQKRWDAPKQSVVNGASIPQAFWSVIGGPFEGKYRNASVVHDVACEKMSENWQDVHRMFYEACRCGGVDESKAKLMYWAVYHFGPRWKPVHETFKAPGGKMKTVTRWIKNVPTPPSDETVERALAYFQEHNPDLTDIPGLEIEAP